MPLLVLALFFSCSCNRLLNTWNPPAVNELTLSIENKTDFQLEVDEMVTLNAVQNGFNFTVAQIEWSANSGQFNTATGNSVIFITPNNPGTVIIQMKATGDNMVVTKDFTITVIVRDNKAPSIPQGFSVTPSDNSLILSWTENKTENIGGYYLYYSTLADKFEYAKDMGLTHTYTLSGLENNKPYYVSIAAYDTSTKKNNSALSQKLNAIPIDINKPGHPILIKVIANDNNSVSLTWQNPSDADFVGVTVRRKLFGVPNKDEGTEIASGNISTFTDTSVEPGKEYFYAIYAFDEVPWYSEPATRSVMVIDKSSWK